LSGSISLQPAIGKGGTLWVVGNYRLLGSLYRENPSTHGRGAERLDRRATAVRATEGYPGKLLQAGALAPTVMPNEAPISSTSRRSIVAVPLHGRLFLSIAFLSSSWKRIRCGTSTICSPTPPRLRPRRSGLRFLEEEDERGHGPPASSVPRALSPVKGRTGLLARRSTLKVPRRFGCPPRR
jgi:hypothetical protein